MTDGEREALLVECLEEYHRLRARGEPVDPERWRARAGPLYGELRRILAAESAIDGLIEPRPDPAALPRDCGAYRLRAVLGRSSTAVVYDALEIESGRKLALKLLRTGFEDEPDLTDEFRRAVDPILEVRHDHLLPILDSGEIDHLPFYTMDFIEDCTLADLIRADVPPRPVDLCAGLAEVADALVAVHAAGQVHREVDAANLFVGTDGSMLLAEIGVGRAVLDRAVRDHGLAGAVRCTGRPTSMSPEQVQGLTSEIDARTDIYAVGAVMYEVLAGRPPFVGEDDTDVARKIATERPRPLAEMAPDLSDDCVRIVTKAMEKRREDRYPSAAELRADLHAFSEGRRVRGRPVSPLRHHLRRFGRILSPRPPED